MSQLKEILEKFEMFRIYKKYRSKEDYENEYNLDDQQLEDFENFIRKQIPETLENILQNPNYKFNGSPGREHLDYLADCPFISIEDLQFSEFPGENFYLAYIFEKNCNYFYLSLCFKVGPQRNKDRRVQLKQLSDKFRDLLKNYINADDLLNHIDLNSKKRGKEYECANIFAKRYDKDDLPSSDDLIRDLRYFLFLYEISKVVYFENLSLFNEDLDKETMDEWTKNIKQIYSKILFNTFLGFKGIFFNQETIENYLLSLKVKPFIILTGNSGTGKTKLSQLFADYLYYKMGCNYKIIPVGANWTDNRNIFGFYNVISKEYQSTPALSLIIEASEEDNKEKPYFLILDEMNLSHVERYFSDFLSSIESKKPIPLHNRKNNDANNGSNNEDNEGDNENNNNSSEINGNPIKPDLIIPPNLFVVGTVNVDETTYMFSPKVLDRANVLEFETFSPSTISIDRFMNNSYDEYNFTNVPFDRINYLENPLSDLGILDNPMSFFKHELDSIKIDSEDEGTVEEAQLWGALSHQLTYLHKTLKKSGFDFGFRVVKEVIAFMYVAWKYEGEQDSFTNWERYFDAQIVQKILPKIHGSKKVLGETLDELLSFCLDCNKNEIDDTLEDLKNDDGEFNLSEIRYPKSVKKLAEMREVLEKQRYVSFIN